MQGFTLIETLIYIAILSLIMIAIIPSVYYLESTQNRLRQKAIEVENNIFFSIIHITTSITTPTI